MATRTATRTASSFTYVAYLPVVSAALVLVVAGVLTLLAALVLRQKYYCTGPEISKLSVAVDPATGLLTVKNALEVNIGNGVVGSSSSERLRVYRHRLDGRNEAPRATGLARLVVATPGSSCISFASGSIAEKKFALRNFIDGDRVFTYLAVGGFPVYQAPANLGSGNQDMSALDRNGDPVIPTIAPAVARGLQSCGQTPGSYVRSVPCAVSANYSERVSKLGVMRNCAVGTDNAEPGAAAVPGVFKDPIAKTYNGTGRVLVENTTCSDIGIDIDDDDEDSAVNCQEPDKTLPWLRSVYDVQDPETFTCDNLVTSSGSRRVLCGNPQGEGTTCVDVAQCDVAQCTEGTPDLVAVEATPSTIENCPIYRISSSTCDPCRSVLDRSKCEDHYTYRYVYLNGSWKEIAHYCGYNDDTGYCSLAGAIENVTRASGEGGKVCPVPSYDGDSSYIVRGNVLREAQLHGKAQCRTKAVSNLDVFLCDYHTHDPAIYDNAEPMPASFQCPEIEGV